jgi:hypothetical protein
MFVKYNPKDGHVKTIPMIANTSSGKAVPLASDSVILRPGTNELTEKEWAAIQPHVQDEIEQKIIVPFTVQVKEAGGKIVKARTLKDVPVATARKIIESCQNVADLKKWVKQELPDEIMLIVLKRLRKFRIDPDEFSDDLTGDTDSLDKDITLEGADSVTEPKADTADTEENHSEESPDPRRGRKRAGAKRPALPAEGEGGDGGSEDEDQDEKIPDFDGSRDQE